MELGDWIPTIEFAVLTTALSYSEHRELCRPESRQDVEGAKGKDEDF